MSPAPNVKAPTELSLLPRAAGDAAAARVVSLEVPLIPRTHRDSTPGVASTSRSRPGPPRSPSPGPQELGPPTPSHPRRPSPPSTALRAPDRPSHRRRSDDTPPPPTTAPASSLRPAPPGFSLTSCAQTGAGKSKRRGEARPKASTLSSRSSPPSAGPGTTRGRWRGVAMAQAPSRSARGWLGRTERAHDGLSQPWTLARLLRTASYPRLPAPSRAGREGLGAGFVRGGPSSGPAPTMPRCVLGLLGSPRTGASYGPRPLPTCYGAGSALAIVPSPFTPTLSRSISPFSPFRLVPDSGTQRSLFSQSLSTLYVYTL